MSREQGLPLHADVRDPHPGSLHDRDHDVRARPVVLEPDLGGTDGRVGESLGPGEGLERRHVPVEDVLAEQPLLEDARGARRDHRPQPLGREGDVADEHHRRDAHFRPLGHHEPDRRWVDGAVESSRDAGEGVPSLAVEGLQLPRARLDLELVHRAAVEQGQTVPEHGLRHGAPSGEGHRVSPAGIDVHDEVDPRGVRDPAGRAGGDASLEESLAPQPLLEGAHPFAHRGLPVSVAGAEAQRLGHGLLGQPERPFETDLREPDRYPGGQDDGDVLRRLSGDGHGLDLDPSVEIALAAVEREEVLAGAGEPFRGCLLADRKGCRRDELTEVEPRVALPDDPAHERPRRQVVAQADALRRIDLLDEDVREESECPQPLEALPHGMPRARAADHLADHAPDERLGDRGGGDEVDRRDDRPRTVLRLGGARPGRGHEPEHRREGDGRAAARPHRNRRRRTTPAA